MADTLQHYLIGPANQLSQRQVETSETGSDGLTAEDRRSRVRRQQVTLLMIGVKGEVPTCCVGVALTGPESGPLQGLCWMPHPTDRPPQTGPEPVCPLPVCPLEL